MIEEEDALDCVPYVAAKSTTQYVFPQECMNFPNIINPSSSVNPKLHLCLRCYEGEGRNKSVNIWSIGIDVNDENDQFMTIPGSCDVRIIKQVVGKTLHVAINPIHRAQILAKSIRSKITPSAMCGVSILSSRSPSKANVVKTKEAIAADEIEDILIEISEKKTQVPSEKKTHRRTPSQHIKPVAENDKTMNFVSVLFKHVCIIIVNEGSCTHTEAVRINVDGLSCVLRPHASNENQIRIMNVPYEKYQAVISIGDLQIDNQLQEQGFDFLVVLMAQNHPNLAPINLDDVRQSSCFSLLHVDLTFTKYDDAVSLQSVRLSSKPLSVYLEDKFLYKILDILKIVNPSGMDYNSTAKFSIFVRSDMRLIPDELNVVSDVLASPIKLEEIIIDPVQVMLSIHASMKLYLSIDCTSLLFKSYRRFKLNTSSYAIGRDLTMHYLSGALLRAGMCRHLYLTVGKR